MKQIKYDENFRKYLDLIQNVISRMCTLSYIIKGWTLTLFGALFLYIIQNSIKSKIPFFILIILFWILDSYFLYTEKRYRQLYSEVVDKKIKKYFSLEIDIKYSEWIYLSVLNRTLVIFYGSLLVVLYLI